MTPGWINALLEYETLRQAEEFARDRAMIGVGVDGKPGVGADPPGRVPT